MPFTDLSDAIAAWLYGVYTQPAGLIYIVDGNTVSDVNAYSVYDIEEVILVQNAAALATTAAGQQELVLVRTKRWKGKSGLTAAAQSGLVNVSAYHPKARWYQNLYVGAYRNWEKFSVGVSANYQRDVFPDTIPNHVTIAPDQVARWRLNGYVDWRPNPHHLLEFTLSYVPERLTANWDSAFQPENILTRNGATQRWVLPHFHYHTNPAAGLTDDFQVSDLHSTFTADDWSLGPAGYPPGWLSVDSVHYHQKSYHLLVWNRFDYRGKIKNVDIDMGISGSYEYCREGSTELGLEIGEPPPGLAGTRQVYSGFVDTATYIPKFWYVTPSVDFSYKRTFDLQAGVLMQAGKLHGPNNEQGFPWVTMSLDVLRAIHESGASSLRLFGSYARRTVSTLSGYGLTDETYGPEIANPFVLFAPNNGVYGVGNGSYFFASGGAKPDFGVGEAGVSFSTWKDRLLVQYNWEQRNYLTGIWIQFAYIANTTYFAEIESMLHHVDLRVKMLDGPGLRWQSDLNITMLRNRIKDSFLVGHEIISFGDLSPNPYSAVGGWVNRIQLKGFTAGLDLLYHFGETKLVPVYPGGDVVRANGKQNSVVVPNIYAGYGWKQPGIGMLEFFVESRGLVRSGNGDLTDGRRYYTIGGKLTM